MRRKISEIEVIPWTGFTKTETALMCNNDMPENIDEYESWYKTFPDFKEEAEAAFKKGPKAALRYYLENMAPLKNTDKFIELIKNHNKFDEICFFGDYDVDGVTATAIGTFALSRLGYNVHYSVPDRLKDGYGKQKIKEDVEKYDTKLAITVDNGVSAKDFVNEAKSLGVTVFVTDHHLPEEGKVPDCVIVDPNYNFDEGATGNCGAVVILKLMYELYKVMAPEKLDIFDNLAPIAGVATIADMMPMIGENRILVKATLAEINRTKGFVNTMYGPTVNVIRTPFQKILFALGGKDFYNSTEDIATEELIGFNIGPVINAVSRVTGKVNDLIDGILGTLQSDTFRMRQFTSFNVTRKNMTEDLLRNYKYDKNFEKTSVFVYEDDNFYYSIKGVIGIIANKISKSKNVVTLIGHRGKNSETIDFSGRSIPGYNLNEGIQRIKEAHPEFGLDGGGHASALGVKIKNDNKILEEFKKCLEEDVSQNSYPYEELIWEFEDEYANEIIDTLYHYQPYGELWNKLKFIYKGVFKSFDNDNKLAEIGNHLFKMYVPMSTIADSLNKEVEVEFTISFDKLDQNGKIKHEFKGTLKK